jgi:hypothetical protein
VVNILKYSLVFPLRLRDSASLREVILDHCFLF